MKLYLYNHNCIPFIRSPDIISARIYDQYKNKLSEIGSKSLAISNELNFKRYSEVVSTNDTTVVITPLYKELNQNSLPSAWLVLELNRERIELQQYELSGVLILLLVIFSACYSLFSLHLASKFSIPIECLNHALEKASEGHYDDIKNLSIPEEYYPMLMGIITIVERLEHNREDMLKSIDQATKDMRRNMDNMEEKSAQLHIANKEKSESNRLKKPIPCKY